MTVSLIFGCNFGHRLGDLLQLLINLSHKFSIEIYSGLLQPCKSCWLVYAIVEILHIFKEMTLDNYY